MKIKEIQAKNILSKSKVYDWTINPYVGCQHGCFYCYARFMKRFSGHKEKWGEFVDVKINAPELLGREIKKKKKGRVWISGVCDPYQPVEKKYELTKKCLEILQRNNWPVVIQTKSSLVLRDLELLKKFQDIEVGFSIATGNEEIRKIFESRTPPINERIEDLDGLHQEGIKTYAMIAPLLPKAESLIPKLKGKVDYVIIDKMNYHYADWVYKKYQLEKIRNGRALAALFKKENISCQVTF
ncbi:radical SAM protein [Patescibacteria group bacterium]|nr:radical SAM protein [Patescibacteria group bacterium]